MYKEVSEIAYEINKIESVALVDLKGEKKDQYNVQIDSNKLSQYNLSLGQISNRIKALAYTSANINSDNLEDTLTVMSIKNSIESKEDLENIIISYNFGTAVYLKDIAKVEKSYDIQNKKEAYLYTKDIKDGTSQVTLAVSKLKGSNSVTINEKIFSFIEAKKMN